MDVAVTGSQKALSIPTGLAMVCASDKALACMKTATSKRVYYDFADMLRTNPSGNVPYTPILPLLYGMEASLNMLKAEGGMPAVAARHHRLAEGCRKAVEGWGLRTLCRDARWKSDSLTVIEVPEGVDSQRVVDVAYAKWVLVLGLPACPALRAPACWFAGVAGKRSCCWLAGWLGGTGTAAALTVALS